MNEARGAFAEVSEASVVIEPARSMIAAGDALYAAGSAKVLVSMPDSITSELERSVLNVVDTLDATGSGRRTIFRPEIMKYLLAAAAVEIQ